MHTVAFKTGEQICIQAPHKKVNHRSHRQKYTSVANLHPACIFAPGCKLRKTRLLIDTLVTLLLPNKEKWDRGDKGNDLSSGERNTVVTQFLETLEERQKTFPFYSFLLHEAELFRNMN